MAKRKETRTINNVRIYVGEQKKTPGEQTYHIYLFLYYTRVSIVYGISGTGDIVTFEKLKNFS